MAERKAVRLSKAAREFNVGLSTIVEFLGKKGFELDLNPNSKIAPEQYDLLLEEYSSDLNVKKESEKLTLKNLRERQESITLEDVAGQKDGDDGEELLITDTTAAKIEAVKEEAPPREPVVAEEIAEEKQPEEKASVPVDAERAAGKGSESPAAPEKAAKKTSKKKSDEKAAAAVVDEAGSGPVEEAKADESAVGEEPVAETGPKVVGRIDLDQVKSRKKSKTAEAATEKKEAEKDEAIAGKAPAAEEKKPVADQEPPAKEEKREKEKKAEDDNLIPTRSEKLSGPTVVGKIKLPEKRETKKKPVASSKDSDLHLDQKKKRKRIRKDGPVDIGNAKKGDRSGRKRGRSNRPEVSEEDVQKQIKDTLAKLTNKGTKSKSSKYRREKRDAVQQRMMQEQEQMVQQQNVLQVTEFVSVSELASMMNTPPNQVIATCMSLGLFVSINQRLDAETMAIVADEFGYKIEFVSVDVVESIAEEEDDPADLEPRSPIVTVMGHVDHGKTKLLDVIRHADVVAGEAGGITQHIGAYSVTLGDGRKITFLDTPGHEAFTAMRARGAQITDVAIIVVAADDGVKPQTVEAINHASAAGVPIVFAINKIDLPAANPEKIKEELANMNYLVEDWGGKFQSQEISAKGNQNIEELLEKVLLEAELLELKANPKKGARGTIVESTLDKGRGNVATILVQAGTLRIGDVVLAGQYYGHVKAMFNERGKKIDEAGPATPALILGLNGAPQAGESFNVMGTDKEAKEIANKREQLQREQELRTNKHITLDEIGRRIAIGNFQELNVIVKGDVDGSIEALSDSLIKLSTEEIQVNIKHKAVGQISESDILLAAASNAIVIGFQVRPSLSARKLAEKEQIDIRLYSIIYDAIEEVKSAMEGMLSPEIKEEIVGSLEILETFKITKVGTIAGCMVKEGKIKRSNKVRLIRDGIVIYSGELGSLKRFKDDAKEVVSGLECGLNIENFNDIKVGDVVEAFEETELERTL